MAYRTTWPAVYPGLSKLPPNQVHHLTIDTLRKDTHRIATVAPAMGIYSLICQKALRDTAQYIEDNNLSYADTERLIEWICKRTFTSPVENPASHDDTGSKAGVRSGVENDS
jgi:hypothetical protein